jgi:hypothetical protein
MLISLIALVSAYLSDKLLFVVCALGRCSRAIRDSEPQMQSRVFVESVNLIFCADGVKRQLLSDRFRQERLRRETALERPGI